MRFWKLLACLLGAFTAVGCGSSSPSNGTAPIVDNPYETCYSGDICANPSAYPNLLSCLSTSLPASSGAGFFCTSGCSSDIDCYQVSQNYPAVCVNNLCYLTCLSSSTTCPGFGDQGCFTFTSSSGDLLDLCAP